MISKSNYKTIKIKWENPFLTVILNRPEKRNALNDLMVKELKDIFSAVKEDSSIRSVTLTGAGKVFCSGADLSYLKELKDFSYNENLNDSLNLSKLFLEIYTLPKPVIAVVKGAAIAGGCGLATVCDFVISEKGALFGYPEVKIGFVAALVSAFLIRQIGERRAREMLLSGELYSAEEALKRGLITSVAEKETIEEQALELSLKLSKNSPLAMAESKKILSAAVYKDIKKELEFLARINAKFRETDDFLEGISAFLEKRAPQWGGE
jgi:methylglutaconyl-CoA hydratase